MDYNFNYSVMGDTVHQHTEFQRMAALSYCYSRYFLGTLLFRGRRFRTALFL